MIAHIVWDWVADCSRFMVLWRQRCCLQNCCAFDWRRVFECQQNAVVWHGHQRRADSRRPGNMGRCRTRTGRQESQSWTRRAATQETSAVEQRRDMIASPGTRDEPGGSVLNYLQAARQFVSDVVAQCIAVVQVTDNIGLDHRLRGVFRGASDSQPEVVAVDSNRFERLQRRGWTTTDGCQSPCPNHEPSPGPVHWMTRLIWRPYRTWQAVVETCVLAGFKRRRLTFNQASTSTRNVDSWSTAAVCAIWAEKLFAKFWYKKCAVGLYVGQILLLLTLWCEVIRPKLTQWHHWQLLKPLRCTCWHA